MLNRTDLAALQRLNPGDTIEVHAGAFTVYPTELGLACENVTDDEVIVGELHHVAVALIPTVETMLAGDEGVDETNYEPALVITMPRLEIDDGLTTHSIEAEYMVVSIGDPDVAFFKRVTALDA